MVTDIRTPCLQDEHLPSGVITPTSRLVISKNIYAYSPTILLLIVQGKQNPMCFQILVHKVHPVFVNSQQWGWWKNLSSHHQVNMLTDCSISMQKKKKNATQELLKFEASNIIEIVGAWQTHAELEKKNKKPVCAKTN